MIQRLITLAAKNAFRAALSLTPNRILGSAALHLAKRREFAERYGRSLIATLAPHLGIDGLVTKGIVGPVISAPNDMIVFAHYAKHKNWAEPTNKLFHEFFSKCEKGTYVDIGANIGLTLLRVAQLPNISCIGFEPEPTNFANLTLNVRLNCPFNNVVLHQVAAFDREATVEMALSDFNLGDHRLQLGGASGVASSVKVRAAALDLLLGELQHPIAIKIDTQGAEPFVINGGRQVIGQADLLLMEWWPTGMLKMGADPEAAVAFVRHHFKRGYIWPEGADSCPRPTSISAICDEMLRLYAEWQTTNAYTDLVVFRE